MVMTARTHRLRVYRSRRPLPLIPSQGRGTGSPVARTNQPAVLISAANVAGCLPPNGYMDSNTTIKIDLFFGAQPDVGADVPIERWMILHDRERTRPTDCRKCSTLPTSICSARRNRFTCRRHSLQLRPDLDHRSPGAGGDLLRLPCRREGPSRASAGATANECHHAGCMPSAHQSVPGDWGRSCDQ